MSLNHIHGGDMPFMSNLLAQQTPNVGFTKAVDIALIQFYILYFLTLAALETSIV